MPNQRTRADALREYLTGAAGDGGSQPDQALSLGGYASSTEAVSCGITIANALAGVTVDFAGGANPEGEGVLTAPDAATLIWTPYGESAGPPVTFSGTQTKILEAANDPGSYLRVTATTPLTPGASQITLTPVYNNVFGQNNVSSAQAAGGLVTYRATMVRNESGALVTSFKRWLATLAPRRVSDSGALGGSGSGTIVSTAGFGGWPESGWCQVRTSGGVLKEVVYYTARTLTSLTVPAAGRGLLGTSAAAGAPTDTLDAVPGVAIGLDPDGVTAAGAAVQTIVNETTAPAGVTWNLGVDAAGGLDVGDMGAGTQAVVWVRRHVPAGAVASPRHTVRFVDGFNAF